MFKTINKIRVWVPRLYQIIIDSRKGLDLLTPVNPEKIGLNPDFSFRSSPSGNKYLQNLLSMLNITDEDSILDIGCGKGSALRTMLGFNFSKIDGIEISEKVSKIASKNMTILKADRVKIFNIDATEFDQYGHYNYYYLFNPFPSEVMRSVIIKIEETLLSASRKITIIYNNPICHSDIIKNGIFNKMSEYPDEWGNKYFLYCNLNK